MFASKAAILALVAFFATSTYAVPAGTAAVAAPSQAITENNLDGGDAGRAPATVTICSGSLSPANGCLTISVVSDSCVNLTGGLSFLNKEISNARIPGGFVCTFYEDFGCLNGGVNHHDVAVLTGGDWSLFRVQGIAGTQNFNDLTSSLTCSPL